tara:strand:- start:590 stop:715 length:126 start_codon:yes stop_codon:yes gene_type:complete
MNPIVLINPKGKGMNAENKIMDTKPKIKLSTTETIEKLNII